MFCVIKEINSKMARECFFEELCNANLNDRQEPVIRKEYRVFYKENSKGKGWRQAQVW